ncbi:ABC transporter substrate-binding protein [Verticiella sediminum]|uniref:Thiamine pyrimidine synthase n=1 Tax=Verticiella sediminum TaxID=1247510 RepID=A0A556A978_9BURK|nr:ABC transporter substrate-binding protein [Verticiella sediminum]TSH89447.1 ABC transporter substrate-binding protein [Verticiella sediminum]
MKDDIVRRCVSALACALALVLAAGPTAATAAEKVSLRLKWLPQTQFAGFYVAQGKNFYADAGLDLTINPGGPNLNVETLVASGSDQFGLASGSEGLLHSRAKGLPIVGIGMNLQQTPNMYVAFKDSGIDSIEDFRGKRVSTWFTGAQYILYSVLAKAGIKQSELTIVPQPATTTQFVNRQLDVATVNVYNSLIALQTQGVTDLVLFKAEDYGVSSPQDVVIASERIVADKPEVVQAFLDATLKGWKYAFENKAEAVDIVMAAAPGLDRRHQELMLDEIEKLMYAGQGSTRGLGVIDVDTLASVQQMLLDYGALEREVDLGKAVDTRFWDAAPAAYKVR